MRNYRKIAAELLLSSACITMAGVAQAGQWQTGYPPDFSGLSGSNQWMTCTGSATGGDGSDVTESGVGESVARSVYDQVLEFVNDANRDPGYIVIKCNW